MDDRPWSQVGPHLGELVLAIQALSQRSVELAVAMADRQLNLFD